LAALAIGLFAILTLFDKASNDMVGWWSLTVAYWTFFGLTMYFFLNWIYTVKISDSLFHKRIDVGEIQEKVKDNALIFFLCKHIWLNFDSKIVNKVMYAFLIIGTVLSILVWHFVAFRG
jgi:hypothetical protein